MAGERQSPQTPTAGGGLITQPIRVLVVDDSSLTRRVLTAALDSDDGITVVGTAASGPEALALVQELKPNVVTLDVEMPGMDGHEVLRQLMARSPAPVIMVSYLTHDGATATARALLDGAVDFVPKPGGPILGTVTTLRDELVRKVREAARSRPHAARRGPLVGRTEQTVARLAEDQAAPPVYSARQRTAQAFDRLVVIGASTGGPEALQTVVRSLRPDGQTAYVIVQHMPGGMTGVLAAMLDGSSQLAIREAQVSDRLAADTVLLAPGDHHLRLGPGGSVDLDQGPKVHFVRPSVDVTLLSAAEVYGCRTIVAMLTGMGSDGADGAEAIHRAGGKIIAQDEATCVVWGMPKAVVRRGIADQIVPLPEVAGTIRQLTSRPAYGGKQAAV